MQGIDDSFLVPRAPQTSEDLRAAVAPVEPNEASVNDYPGLAKTSSEIPYQQLLSDYQTRMLNLLSNRIVQFVRQVAGNLNLELNDFLLDIYKDLVRYLNTAIPKPTDAAFIKKLSPETLRTMQDITPEDAEAYANRQAARQFVALERLFTLPSMLSEVYFKAELASHTRESILRIQQVCNLQNVSSSFLYDYLLHSDKWMPRFARMVSSWIIFDRREKGVSTTGLQFQRASNALFTITMLFKDEFTLDANDRVKPAPARRPMKQETQSATETPAASPTKSKSSTHMQTATDSPPPTPVKRQKSQSSHRRSPSATYSETELLQAKFAHVDM